MNQAIEILNSAVEKYSSREYLEDILKAKNEYFELTGKISDDDVDYESRMNGFNYWYLTQRNADFDKSLLHDFIINTNVPEEFKKVLETINHSLFEYRGVSFTKKHIFFDILHDKKFSISKEQFNFQLIKDDLFIARSISVDNSIVLLDDISVLPVEIKSILIKESKKVRKLHDKSRDLQFLMTIEKLKTKWRRYGHIDAKKIFKFNF